MPMGAVAEVPTRIARVEAADERYQVYSPLEIEAILRRLVTQRALVTVHASGHFFVTAALAVLPEQEIVVFDYGMDEATTSRILDAPRIVFVTTQDHIRVQFAAMAATAVLFEQAPAFSIPFPPVLTRLQRREYYRLRLPADRSFACQVTVQAADPFAEPRRHSLTAYDLSCGGIALTGYPSSLGPARGTIYRGARLLLPDLPVVTADLEVVHVQSASGLEPARLGCRFITTSDGAQTLVQRFINRVEREMRARW